MYNILKLFNPEMFQGKHKSKNYFEGWYFKLSDESGINSLAIIPGISYGENAQDKHAFIQVLDVTNKAAHYLRFEISSFSYSSTDFGISIGDNTFGAAGMHLDLRGEGVAVKGTLEFFDITGFPKTATSPGIMGPFSYVPFIECRHGVVNVSSSIRGSLKLGEEEIDFTNGRCYIEKDWGRSFPEWWVWMHSDRFERAGAAFMFSAAKVPWLGIHFTGFLSFLKIGDELYRFATYTGARIRQLEYKDGKIKIAVRDRKHLLTISGSCSESGVLKAPENGRMLRDIRESISSDIHVTLRDLKGTLIFEGNGKNAGVEIEMD